MDNDVKEALHKYKIAKKRLAAERTYLLSILPDRVASELHYNGPHRAKDTYPEFSEILKELYDLE